MNDDEFRPFVEARWPALVRFAWSLVGDRGHAEDLVQTALERSWLRWSRIRPGNAEAYVRAALVNLAVSRHRRRRLAETAWHAGLDEMPEPVAGDVDEAVLAALRELPPRMRAVVVLRFLEDLSEAQTAELLQCSVGTVKSQASRAIVRLRQRPGLFEAAGANAKEPQS